MSAQGLWSSAAGCTNLAQCATFQFSHLQISLCLSSLPHPLFCRSFFGGGSSLLLIKALAGIWLIIDLFILILAAPASESISVTKSEQLYKHSGFFSFS